MSILPRDLAQAFFPELLRALTSAKGLESRWRVVDHNFPFVALHVIHAEGMPLVGLLIDARDWPHRPFSVRAATPDFKRRLKAEELPRIRDEAGEAHVYDDPKAMEAGAYFCVQGTREYHEDYAHVVAWENVRHLKEFEPVWVVNNCVSMLDRNVPLQVAEVSAP
jgi:hypothetical protein